MSDLEKFVEDILELDLHDYQKEWLKTEAKKLVIKVGRSKIRFVTKGREI